MTVIATDGKTIAADTGGFFGDERCARRSRKLFVREGMIFGMAGCSGMYKRVIDWYVDGADPKEVPPKFESQGWSMLVISNCGPMHYLTSEVPYPAAVGAPFAHGAGERVATVAMRCGKTAPESVALAIEMLNTCDGEVDVINIADALKQPAI